MRPVNIGAPAWSGVRASLAESFKDRLFGIRSRSSEDAVLIRTSSVHTLGLRRSLNVVGIDHDLNVIDRRLLEPNRVAYFRGARYVMELAENASTPEIGSHVWIRNV